MLHLPEKSDRDGDGEARRDGVDRTIFSNAHTEARHGQ